MFLRWPSEVANVADVRREAIDACGAMDEIGRNQEPLRRMGVDELLATPVHIRPVRPPILDPPEGTG